MTNEPLETPDENSKAGIRKTLALAATHGIGPFRKRVRLEDPLPYEPEETYTSFTIDVYPPKPEWKYDGKLADRPTSLMKTYYPSLSDGWIKSRNTPQNIGILSFLEDKKTTEEYRTANDKRRYDHGFKFNRNGMHYRIEFFKPYSYHTPSCDFTISPSDDEHMGFFEERRMTRQEAEYALSIVKTELDPYDQTRLRAHIERLGANLPTETVPQKTALETLKDIRFMDTGTSLDPETFQRSFGTASNKFRTFYAGNSSVLSQKLKRILGNLPNP